MPKSSLTIEETLVVDELTRLMYADVWTRGLSEESLTQEEQLQFYALGELLMTEEGFDAFY